MKWSRGQIEGKPAQHASGFTRTVEKKTPPAFSQAITRSILTAADMYRPSSRVFTL